MRLLDAGPEVPEYFTWWRDVHRAVPQAFDTVQAARDLQVRLLIEITGSDCEACAREVEHLFLGGYPSMSRALGR